MSPAGCQTSPSARYLRKWRSTTSQTWLRRGSHRGPSAALMAAIETITAWPLATKGDVPMASNTLDASTDLSSTPAGSSGSA